MSESELKETLTAKQVKFCQEYLVDLNGTQAAIRAGYSIDTATVIASQNLTKLNIKAYIEELQKEAATALQITKEKVIRGLNMLAFYDIRKFYDETGKLKNVNELDEETAFALTALEITEESEWVDKSKAITGFTKKIKTSDRKAALDMLNKMLGYYAPEKSQVKTNVFLSDEPVIFK